MATMLQQHCLSNIAFGACDLCFWFLAPVRLEHPQLQATAPGRSFRPFWVLQVTAAGAGNAGGWIQDQ